MVRAWLDYVSCHAEAQRVYWVCLPRLPEPHRTHVNDRFRGALDTVAEALMAVVPGLTRASEGLLKAIRALLSDAWSWPAGADAEPRGQAARRMAGMLVAAGRAEAEGLWAGFGPVAGMEPMARRVVESSEVRTGSRRRWRM